MATASSIKDRLWPWDRWVAMFRGFQEMEEGRRDGCCEVTERDLKGEGGGGGGDDDGVGVKEEGEEIGAAAEEDQCENDDALKRSISNHPLYGELVEVHLNCLRVGGACEDGMAHQTMMNPQVHRCQHQHGEAKKRTPSQSDLDRFMEAYCSVLSELREAMEEPQQETMAFIDDMHSQLKDMITTPASSAAGPGETNA
ncbi:homeobox protein knotted-1-like 8 [Rhodamnia argentea]|uniref:Homeobox protein knotted-1-like 8 n=1 Tax=Rhodamnia argentea TaxID=178133 RepID=A0A8B8NH58_9MYRT|nr:homeobox protein knotted-1-like 8 [Rhodamnia argentea]